MTVGQMIQQKTYEDRVVTLHRHWIVLLRDILFAGFLAAIPVLLYAVLRANAPEILSHRVGYPALVLAASAYELGIWLFLFTQFLDYQLDLWVVTNDRLIAIEQRGLFSRTVAEFDLWRIQDATSAVEGIIPTVFNYGNVHVQTAGAIERAVLLQVPRPHEVRKLILDMADIDRKFHTRDVADVKALAATG